MSQPKSGLIVPMHLSVDTLRIKRVSPHMAPDGDWCLGGPEGKCSLQGIRRREGYFSPVRMSLLLRPGALLCLKDPERGNQNDGLEAKTNTSKQSRVCGCLY